MIRKPTDEEMDKATELAVAMRVRGRDKYSLAHALLYLKERNALLEDLHMKAEHYFRFGMAERELRVLRIALDKLREQNVSDTEESSLFINS